MTTFQSPDVRFREAPTNDAAFPGLDNEGTTAIVVVTKKGPVGKNVLVTSGEEFRSVFGLGDEVASAWVDLYFTNSGGQGELIVHRTAHYTDPADPSTLTAAKATLTLEDTAPGYSLSDVEPALVTSPTAFQFDIALSGEVAQTVVLGTALAGGPAIAAAIQAAVRALTEAVPANAPDYDNFLCIFTEDNRFLLINGTAGAGKTVVVTDAGANNVADELKLGLANGGVEDDGNVESIRVDSLSEGVHGNTVSLSTSLQNKINTTLAADLVNGAQFLDLTNIAGVVPGTILEITDVTAPLNVPNPILLEVDSVSGGLAQLAAPVALSDTIQAGATVRSLEWKLIVKDGGVEREVYENLSMNPRNVDDYFENKVNPVSALIQLVDLAAPSIPPTDRPAVITDSFLLGGDDGLVGLTDADFVGTVTGTGVKTGLQAFRDNESINFVCVPDRPTQTIHRAMIALAEELDVFEVILDPPPGLDRDGIVAYVQTTAQLASDYASIYWPNVFMSDPRDRSQDLLIGPSAYIAGMRARNANTDGVTIAQPPGGVRFASRGVVGVEDEDVFLKSTRDVIYPARINPITRFRGTGIFALGVQTLLPGGTGGLGEVQKRAVFQKVKREVTLIVRNRLISEAADQYLLRSLQTTIESYLATLRSQGYLPGNSDAEAFRVNFGPDLNPPEQLERGVVSGRVGVALNKAFEFADFEIFEYVSARSASVAS